MTYHSLIILASILLNLFYSINGRSIQCPSEWITNGDEGKTLLKTNTSRTAEAGGSRGTHAPRFQHIRSTRFSVLAPSGPCPCKCRQSRLFFVSGYSVGIQTGILEKFCYCLLNRWSLSDFTKIEGTKMEGTKMGPLPTLNSH